MIEQNELQVSFWAPLVEYTHLPYLFSSADMNIHCKSMTSSAALTTCLRWSAWPQWPLCGGISIVMDRATLKQELEKVIAVGPGKALMMMPVNI